MVVPVTARHNNDAERQQRQQRDGFHCASFPQEKSAQWSPDPLALHSTSWTYLAAVYEVRKIAIRANDSASAEVFRLKQ
jgi:hypothetical protein